MKNFAVIVDSDYGKFVMNKNDDYQPEMIETRKPHIHAEVDFMIAIMKMLPNDSVVVDIGGNIGLFAVPMSVMLSQKNGKVYSFEAQRIISYMLTSNAVINNLTNLYTYNMAVSDVDNEWLNIPQIDYEASQDFGGITFKDADTDTSKFFIGKDKVRTIKVDSIGLDRVDLIKIDVEGMETRVLAGAAKTIKKYQPLIYIEYHMDPSLSEVMKALGYRLFVVDSQNWFCVPAGKESFIPQNLREV